MPAIPRYYQEECRDAVLSAWGEEPWYDGQGETFRSVLINLATSAGKTFTAGDLIQAVRDRGKCLYIADTDELCDQPRKKFYKLFGMHAALEKAGDKASRHADIVIGSAQTLIRENRLKRFARDHFKYIFVDEAHRGSDRNKEITDYFADAKLAGMTATAFRKNLADLSDYYEEVAYELGVFDLIDAGFNAPLNVLMLPVSVDLRNVHQRVSTEGMDYDKNELDTTIAPYYEEICDLVVKHASDRHIICYLPLIKSSQEFVKIAQAHGINAYHIDGTSENRVRILEMFDRGDIQLLCNSNLLTTGWDSPRCDCLLNLRPTRSMGLFRQMAGRIGRVLPGIIDHLPKREQAEERKKLIAASAKPNALILDLLWQTERFGLMGPADLIASNSEEKEAVQMRLRRLTSPEDLQAVTSQVQEEREEQLRKALEDAAKRRSYATAAINAIAIALHGRKILNYEPVMKWENKPVTDKQREWLERNGIDPTTARDRGHVSKLMDLLFRRRKAGLGSWKVVEALAKRGIRDAVNMSDRGAYQILGGDYPFPFGKHSNTGKTLKQVPAHYLVWCSQQDWVAKQYPIVADYIDRVLSTAEAAKDNRQRAEGCTCIGAYVAPNCAVHRREVPQAELMFDKLD